MNFDISVIIPTYNVSSFIIDALQSIQKQNFEGRIETIVIDDCSTDDTLEIINEFKNNNPNFNLRVLKQEQNLRQGTARNRGIKESLGKYIFFLDGDDFIAENAFKEMFKKAEELSCDFVLCDWAYFYEDRGLVYVNNDLFLFKDKLVDEQCEQLLQASAYFTVNKLYSRQFLLDNDIKFGEGYIYEDVEFYVLVAQNAQTIGVISNPFYRVRVNQFSTTKTNKKSLIHVKSFLTAIENTIRVFEPRHKHSYYHLYKYIVRKSISYSKTRAPFGHQRRTLSNALNILNKKNVNYKVPEKIVALNNLYFKRRLVQKNQVSLILFVNYLHSKGLLEKLFNNLKSTKNKILKTKLVSKHIQKRARLQREELFKQPIEQKILFLGFDYRYAGNSKYLFDFLVQRNDDIKINFVTKDKSVPKQYRITPRSEKFYEALATSRIIFAESWIPLDFKKRDEAVWVQLWHGTPFKRLFFDSNEPYISKFNRNQKRLKQKDIKRWDYLLSDSIESGKKLQSAFEFEQSNILNYGYPRVQWLKENKDNDSLKSKIKEKMNISQNKKIILYVPTWRDYNFKQKRPDFSYLINFSNLSHLEEEYQIIYKGHTMESKINSDAVIEPAPDIETQELVLISDIIISDYSSIIFDAIAVDKYFYLFIKDFDKYSEARGLYLDMHKELAPFYISQERELIDKLEEIKTSYPKIQYQNVKNLYTSQGYNSNELLSLKINDLINETQEA